MREIRKFLTLPPRRQLLLVTASVLFGVFWVAIRIRSVEAGERLSRGLADVGLSRWVLEDVVWAITVVESKRVGNGGCLPAALTGLALADEEPLELQIGVRKSGESIEAHAWVRSQNGELLYAGADPAEFHRLNGG